MLGAMRDASKNWLGKLVLGVLFSLLILSFAVWGIGDIFRGFGAGKVASAGDIEIPTDEYRAEYQTVLQNLQRRLRRVVTNDQARAEGIDKMVLNRMISDALVEKQATKFGLAMNNKAVAQGVLEDPRFKTPTGSFDRLAFQRALSDNGLNEQRFLDKQRAGYMRAQLVNSFAEDIPVPRAMLEILHRLGTETRSVEYFNLTETNAGTIPAPTDADLTKYFDARKAAYRAPEYRKVVTLAVTTASIAKPADITDEAAKKLYESVKAQKYSTPEKRDIRQIIFKPGEESAAQSALDKIKGGAKFEAVAAERKLKAADINLGSLEKSKISDPAIAEAAFATAAGQVSTVIKSRFGPAIINVVKIEPASTKPYDSVKDELKKDLAATKARTDIRKIYEKIEDQRTSGKVLEEAAKAAGLKVRIIEAIDAKGLDKSGAPVKDIVEARQFLPAVFASDIGVDNDTLTIPSGGNIWFEIAAIEQARDRKLDEVKARVTAAWRAQEVARKLRELADAAVKKLAEGQKIADVAKELNVKVELAPDVKRTTHPKLAKAAVDRIFSLPVGKAGTAPVSNLERTVFTIGDSSTPPLTDKGEELEQIETQLQQTYQQEMADQFVAKLRKGVKVSYNPVALRTVVGGEAN